MLVGWVAVADQTMRLRELPVLQIQVAVAVAVLIMLR
jgi:hypothetical protein